MFPFDEEMASMGRTKRVSKKTIKRLENLERKLKSEANK
jgi:hypothetical protein